MHTQFTLAHLRLSLLLYNNCNKRRDQQIRKAIKDFTQWNFSRKWLGCRPYPKIPKCQKPLLYYNILLSTARQGGPCTNWPMSKLEREQCSGDEPASYLPMATCFVLHYPPSLGWKKMLPAYCPFSQWQHYVQIPIAPAKTGKVATETNDESPSRHYTPGVRSTALAWEETLPGGVPAFKGWSPQLLPSRVPCTAITEKREKFIAVDEL